jgi:hypothetical protein
MAGVPGSVVQLSDFDDFITPSQACIKPVEVHRAEGKVRQRRERTTGGSQRERERERGKVVLQRECVFRRFSDGSLEIWKCVCMCVWEKKERGEERERRESGNKRMSS